MAAKKYDWTTDEAYLELKEDLLDDLEARGLLGKKYTDKVEEYMSLWCWLKMLNADIAKRGVSVTYTNGATQKGTTENKSLSIATRVSAQMLNIWAALGFREQAISAKTVGGDEDDAL